MTSIRACLLIGLITICITGRAADERLQAVPQPLVTKDRVQLNLAGADLVLAAAKLKASAMGWKMNLAVVDDGGHLLAFARMDGARPASAATAITKAVTAATFRQETGPLPVGGEPDLLLNLSLQNAAAASGGKVTTLKGGVPIVIDGQIVGAIGIGGGSGEQDAEAAKAGVQALIAELSKGKQ
jgi:glc operon protein GlcG